MRKILKGSLWVVMLMLGFGFHQYIEYYRSPRYVDLMDVSEIVERAIPEAYDVMMEDVMQSYKQGLETYFKTSKDDFSYPDPLVEAFLPSYEELTVLLNYPQFKWISPLGMLGLGVLSLIIIRILGPKDSLFVSLGCTLIFFLLGQGRHWYFHLHSLGVYEYLKAAITYRMSLFLVAMNGYLFLDIILALWMVMKKGEAFDE